jgi:four helix bundle protein
MKYVLPHEQLHVYSKALAFVELAGSLAAAWPAKAAVRGQMDRAAESIVTNLARAAYHQSDEKGIYLLECSLGSVLECAACLDVALRRHLIDAARAREAKLMLQEVARMQVGLRSAWSKAMCVREEPAMYAVTVPHFFNHESLVVYQRSLQIHEVLAPVLIGDNKDHRYATRMDELSTSLTLNIAEGNGRFSARDHRTFADSAEDAATKLAAYLDLAAAAWVVDMGPAKSLLREAVAMLGGLRGYLESQDGG